ncbi:MAG TPA: hypothetical protein VGN79_07695 [Devosia sp.]|nr:hypothetical protein [Devosia sp.]
METIAGPSLWLILLTVGVVVLGLAAVFGVMRNRKLTRGEHAARDAGTVREYKVEDRDPERPR